MFALNSLIQACVKSSNPLAAKLEKVEKYTLLIDGILALALIAAALSKNSLPDLFSKNSALIAGSAAGIAGLDFIALTASSCYAKKEQAKLGFRHMSINDRAAENATVTKSSPSETAAESREEPEQHLCSNSHTPQASKRSKLGVVRRLGSSMSLGQNSSASQATFDQPSILPSPQSDSNLNSSTQAAPPPLPSKESSSSSSKARVGITASAVSTPLSSAAESSSLLPKDGPSEAFWTTFEILYESIFATYCTCTGGQTELTTKDEARTFAAAKYKEFITDRRQQESRYMNRFLCTSAIYTAIFVTDYKRRTMNQHELGVEELQHNFCLFQAYHPPSLACSKTADTAAAYKEDSHWVADVTNDINAIQWAAAVTAEHASPSQKATLTAILQGPMEKTKSGKNSYTPR